MNVWKSLKVKWLILFAVLVFVLDYAQLHMSSENYGTKYNGFGSMDYVLSGDAPAPTQYRLLVPVLYGALDLFYPRLDGEKAIIWLYEPLKMLLMLWAICAFFIFLREFYQEDWALLGTILLCACLPLAFRYDYANQWAELAIFSMAFRAIWRNNQKQATGWTFLGALTRETALVLPLLNFLVNRKKTRGWKWSFLTYGLAFVGTRLLLGPRPRFAPILTMNVNLHRILETTLHPGWLHGTEVFSPYFNPIWLVVPMTGLWIFWSLKKFKEKPAFFRKAFWLIPLFYLTAFCFAYQDEIRIFTWFYLILIPMTLWCWRGDSLENSRDVKSDPILAAQPLFSENPRPVTMQLSAVWDRSQEER